MDNRAFGEPDDYGQIRKKLTQASMIRLRLPANCSGPRNFHSYYYIMQVYKIRQRIYMYL